ncbi:MAG TPA: hypothetical protein VNA67_01980 [Pseudonocardiaceae bacterium]|nr:hypothetical protein [Pseudonocardiaceae bacterium]
MTVAGWGGWCRWSTRTYATGQATTPNRPGALRWYLQQIITLVDEAPQLTDQEMRTRLHALADSCVAR